MILIVIAITVYMVIHTSVTAACVRGCGVRITEIKYGAGPTLLRFGKVTVHWFPISGSVSTLDSRRYDLYDEELTYAFDGQPVWVQVVLPVVGSLFVLLASLLVMGGAAFDSFVSAFPQIIKGAVMPLSAGQVLAADAHHFLEQNPLLVVIVLVQTKMAAFNLLPLTVLGGGQALVNLVGVGRRSVSWENRLNQVSMLLFLLLFAGWSFALVSYLL